MITTITGYDEVSLQVLDLLRKGTKVKDIATAFPISIDQAKRLSRFLNVIHLSELYLSNESLSKIKQL